MSVIDYLLKNKKSQFKRYTFKECKKCKRFEKCEDKKNYSVFMYCPQFAECTKKIKYIGRKIDE